MASVKILQSFYVLMFIGFLNAARDPDRIIFPNEIKSFTTERRPHGRDACYVDGEPGECVYVKNCPELLDFIKSRNGMHTPGTSDYLRKRICQFEVRNAKVCCLTENETPSPSSAYIQLKPFKEPLPGSISPSSLLPSLSDCGITTVNRIVNGKEYAHGTHPWLVGVGYPKANVSLKVHCGGTLITKRHVLSAAHCLVRKPTPDVPELTHVILGEHSLSKDKEKRSPVVVRIAGVKHPGYDRYTQAHDIAILVLEKDVSFTPFIRPACLPISLNAQEMDFSSQKTVIAGWGNTKFGKISDVDEPLQAEVSLIPKSTCQKAYEFEQNLALDDTKICFGGDGKDACLGDSGGPLIYQDFKKFYRYFLIGVVNFGRECGNPLYPGVYSNVAHYLSWINENL